MRGTRVCVLLNCLSLKKFRCSGSSFNVHPHTRNALVSTLKKFRSVTLPRAIPWTFEWLEVNEFVTRSTVYPFPSQSGNLDSGRSEKVLPCNFARRHPLNLKLVGGDRARNAEYSRPPAHPIGQPRLGSSAKSFGL